MKTVVGLFNTTAEAQQVKQALVAQGYSSSNISVHANDAYEDESEGTGYNETTRGTTTGLDTTSAKNTGEGIGHRISNFFSSLTGGDEETHNSYAQGVNQGGALLSVQAEDDQAYSVAALLRQHGARDIEGGTRSASYEETTDKSRGMETATTTGQTSIPIVEEELVVGKREVDLGGVRVYSHIVERPVSADVSLHNERIDIERRAVSRPATAADFQTGSQPIELRATGEEAVVGKNARVVEEVYVGKQGSNRTETVNDTVRKTEVDVEELPGATTTDRTGNYATDSTVATTGTNKDRF